MNTSSKVNVTLNELLDFGFQQEWADLFLLVLKYNNELAAYNQRQTKAGKKRLESTTKELNAKIAEAQSLLESF